MRNLDIFLIKTYVKNYTPQFAYIAYFVRTPHSTYLTRTYALRTSIPALFVSAGTVNSTTPESLLFYCDSPNIHKTSFIQLQS